MAETEVKEPEQVEPNNPTIYVLQGLPGSGKSTWARNKMIRNPKTAVICKDDLRRMIHGGQYVFDPALEPTVHNMDEECIMACLRHGFNVIIDETNLSRARRRELVFTADYMVVCVKQCDSVRKVCVILDGGGNNLDNRMADDRGYTREHWAYVIDNMKLIMEPVGEDEGFDLIVRAKDPTDCLDV